MKMPSNEKIMVSYVFEGVKCYITTYNALKGKFTLYKITGDDYQKLKTTDSPLEFDEIVEKDRGI
jgi:hypothetical protein